MDPVSENSESDVPTRYANYPNHPLYRIRQEVLNTARHAMQEAACCKDVVEEMVNPIADETPEER